MRTSVPPILAALLGAAVSTAQTPPDALRVGTLPERPFGSEFPKLESWTTGRWWDVDAKTATAQPFSLRPPRDQVIAFALYTVDTRKPDAAVLKLSAQLFPLLTGEPMVARLEVADDDGIWQEVATAYVQYPGWDAQFRVDGWDASRDHKYRVRHGDAATFAGVVRKDPRERNDLKIALLSCNSSRTVGPRDEIVQALRAADPDLLFFAGDQTYRHTEHTTGWIEFGLQFRDVMRDRPTITIPDDHDVGHPNVWGEGGVRAKKATGADGGYYYPAAYVNMVQRQQTAHLPDAVDPAPVEQGIGVYFTNYLLGGVDFAILEDRKWKTGPLGTIPQLGPRPDHITDPAYDRKAIDLPELQLLGERQMRWLGDWADAKTGFRAKCVLSQTAFCGAVHMHGGPDDRLLADLDCNGWPQTQRNAALRLIQRAGAIHLCGDQHLAVVVQHGIDAFGDGPWSFTGPALVNTIYGRWWHPEDEQAGANPVAGSPLPWTGNYLDGLGNRIRMVAYANPEKMGDERKRGDGWGLVRYDFAARTATFECWPRFGAAGEDGAPRQYPGWPVTVPLDQ
jgi:3',5'-cyclic AMP phosphodiesterase CpdA